MSEPTAASESSALAVHVLYRRAIAFLVEFSVINVFVLPVVWVLVGDRLSGELGEVEMLGRLRYDLSTPLTMLAFLLARDLFFGGTSPGKRLVGLRVRSAVHAGQPSVMQRGLRNVTLVLTPLFWIIEYFAAKNDPRLRRLGDKLAGTEIVDTNPALAEKHWALGFVVALIGTGLLRSRLTPAVYPLVQNILG